MGKKKPPAQTAQLDNSGKKKPNITPALVPKILPNTQPGPAGKPSFLGDKAGGVYEAPAPKATVPPPQYPGIPGARPPVNPPIPYPGIPRPPTQAPIPTGGSLAGDKQGGTFNAPSSIGTGEKSGGVNDKLNTGLPGTGQHVGGSTPEAQAALDLRTRYERQVLEVDAGFAAYYGLSSQAGFGRTDFAAGDRRALPNSVWTGANTFAYSPFSWLSNPNDITGGGVVTKPDGTPFANEAEYLQYMGYIQLAPGQWVKGDVAENGYGGGGGDGGGGGGGYRRGGYGSSGGSGFSARSGAITWRISP